LPLALPLWWRSALLLAARKRKSRLKPRLRPLKLRPLRLRKRLRLRLRPLTRLLRRLRLTRLLLRRLRLLRPKRRRSRKLHKHSLVAMGRPFGRPICFWAAHLFSGCPFAFGLRHGDITPMPRLPDPPDIAWDDQGRLWDRRYGDIFFSRDDGLAETRLTFLDGCGLPQAWAGRDRFAICELGFGTGLNALAAIQAWRAARPPGAILHFHSIEAHLLDRADAARALSAFPELADLAAVLLAQWPVRCRAPQALWFGPYRVCVTIHQGEAEAILASLDARFDAWFLDGFAPARNGAMWTSSVFAQIARLSAPGARAATFSSAAAVRDGLAGAGFAVTRLAGYGRKRHRRGASP
jgi:tRNA U34 5-methylaminomethyl-2-thiouridine-forming methyltransferase MnmC